VTQQNHSLHVPVPFDSTHIDLLLNDHFDGPGIAHGWVCGWVCVTQQLLMLSMVVCGLSAWWCDLE